jgi:hypothetical protein
VLLADRKQKGREDRPADPQLNPPASWGDRRDIDEIAAYFQKGVLWKVSQQLG